jgi:hypothetical protein
VGKAHPVSLANCTVVGLFELVGAKAAQNDEWLYQVGDKDLFFGKLNDAVHSMRRGEFDRATTVVVRAVQDAVRLDPARFFSSVFLFFLGSFLLCLFYFYFDSVCSPFERPFVSREHRGRSMGATTTTHNYASAQPVCASDLDLCTAASLDCAASPLGERCASRCCSLSPSAHRNCPPPSRSATNVERPAGRRARRLHP